MLDLTWVLSIFKFKSSRAGSNSDARNFRLQGNYFSKKPRRDTTFSRPDSNLASTSASILKAGLHRVWRCTDKSKASSESQKAKQPELPCPKASQHSHVAQPKSAPTLPFPRTGQPERQPADTQHPSRSRFFLLHKAVNKKPDSERSTVRSPKLETSRASPFPQPTAVSNRLPIFSFGSSVKGSESTQGHVGLNIFTAGQYSSSLSSFQVTFLTSRVSPSQSLLFLPPTPPPKRKNLEDTRRPFPLPPSSEPNLKSNQFVTTRPVRSPDHIYMLPSPLLPTGKFLSPRPFTFLIKIIKTKQCLLLHPCSLRKTPKLFPLSLSLCHFLWLRHLYRSSLSALQVRKAT